jgi:molybdopterin synthase sulfur carrier subunit
MPDMNTATIQLKLFATLAAHMPPEGDRVEIAAGATVGDLVSRLAIPAAKAKLIFVDGRKGTLETVLHGGERVGLFPPVGGG